MDELLIQFVVEARDLTQQASDDLIALEREPGDRDRLASVFRAIHTLKGSVGLFPWAPLQKVLHAAEDVLGAAVAEGGDLEGGAVDALLAVVNWVDRCVTVIEETGEAPARAAAEAAELSGLLGASPRRDTPLPAGTDAALPAWATELLDRHPPDGARDWFAIRYQPNAECFFDGDDPLALVAAVPGVVDLRIDPLLPWPAADAFDPFRCNLVIRLLSSAALAEIEATFRLIPDQVTVLRVAKAADRGAAREAGSPPIPAGITTTLRIDAARIDALLEIVGELYTARNGLARVVAAAQGLNGAEGLARQAVSTQRDFDQLLSQLRGAVMDVRMVPLEQTWRRLPRLAREVATRTGKKVELLMSGGALEADKTIVEALFEPLLHVIRNAVDHGIEDPEQRTKAGKAPIGQIRIAAREVGGQIAIEVADDGRGIDMAAVRRRAVERGLIEPATAAALPEARLIDLVFSPGFSTAAGVSEVSGRGVGMDAVRSALDRLGGSVELATVAHQGTTLTLRIPVSLSMSNLLIVEAGGSRFGVPVGSIIETIRLSADALVPVRAGRAFILRDRTVPFVDLAHRLDLTGSTSPDLAVLVADIGDGPVGIGVEAIGEQVEMMMRPPTGLLAGHPHLAGTAVMGDGTVILVLDVAGLVR